MRVAQLAVHRRRAAWVARRFAWVGVLLLTVTGCALPFGGSTSRPSSTPSPTATPRPLTPEELAAQMVARMSQDDKLGQMLIMEFRAPTYTAQQATMVKTFHPGGVVLYRSSMGTTQQVKDLLKSGQQDSPAPMFTLLNAEGGLVDPLAKYFGPSPSPSEIAETGNPTFAESEGGKTGKELLSLGFNADLAPYLTLGNGSGADSRSFGKTPDLVTTFGSAWLTGLQANGVVACALPFPGGGEAAALAPYRALITSGQLQMIMSATVPAPALDPTLPAALSTAVITGILRNELHFNGVAITDVLYSASIANRFSFAQAAVMAIEAGNDMVTGLYSLNIMRDVVTALKAAIAAGKLSQQQVDASVTRILALKLRYSIIATPTGATTVPTTPTTANRVLLRRLDNFYGCLREGLYMQAVRCNSRSQHVALVTQPLLATPWRSQRADRRSGSTAQMTPG